MTEHGVDWLGAEYKRTEHDFSFRCLEQDDCCCSICHGIGAKWEFRYVTRNYQSPKTKKICKTLQAHERSLWICPMCLENMVQITGLQVAKKKEEMLESYDNVANTPIVDIDKIIARHEEIGYERGLRDGYAQAVMDSDATEQWIPVMERLPEESGRYLVTRGLNACGSLWNRIYIANYSDLMGIKSKRIWWQGNVGKSDFERLDDVLAWMPLPKPYEAEKEEE